MDIENQVPHKIFMKVFKESETIATRASHLGRRIKTTEMIFASCRLNEYRKSANLAQQGETSASMYVQYDIIHTGRAACETTEEPEAIDDIIGTPSPSSSSEKKRNIRI